MGIKVALVGNPNCGKTTLFNALTGTNQRIGNWPGVTIEKKEGKWKENAEVTIVDLPGIYSLSPYSLEEVIARNYLLTENPDVILNIIDGTNFERNLYLTTQLREMDIPMVVAINMADLLERNGSSIDLKKLTRELGCEIVSISALKGTGVSEAAKAAMRAASNNTTPILPVYENELEDTLKFLESKLPASVPQTQHRWYAVKLFEKDEEAVTHLDLDETTKAEIDARLAQVEKDKDDDTESIITVARYDLIEHITSNCLKKHSTGELSISGKIDRVVTNRILALPIFALVMWVVYYISIGTIGTWGTDFVNDTFFGEWILPGAASLLEGMGTADWLNSLVVDGAIAGVGAVLGFVPQMLVLFFLLSILEDCGYMARVAFIMDRVFRKFGLSGKSFIPLLVATGCGVPGIMASRTIEQDRDRKMTIMTTAFIPCSAKMPIVALIAGALFNNNPWVAFAAYFIGLGAVIVSGIILKKTRWFAGEAAPFVMELPDYHAPIAGNVLRSTWERGWSFIKRAGTVIFAASVIIWILNSLSVDGGFHYITEENGGASLLENIGNMFAWIFAPLGFGNWQATVSTILGLVAKEEVVGTFGTLSSMANADLAMEGNPTMYAVIASEFFAGSGLVGISFMIFNLLCAPCFAAMGAIKREMNNPKWTAFAIGYMCVFAYAMSLMTYQFGSWLVYGTGDIPGTIAATIVLVGMLYLMFRKPAAKEHAVSLAKSV